MNLIFLSDAYINTLFTVAFSTSMLVEDLNEIVLTRADVMVARAVSGMFPVSISSFVLIGIVQSSSIMVASRSIVRRFGRHMLLL